MAIASSPLNPFAFTRHIREEVKMGLYCSRPVLSFLSQNRYLPTFPMYLDLAVLKHLCMQRWKKNQDLLSVNGASCSRSFARKERKEVLCFVSLEKNLFFFRWDTLVKTISHSKDIQPDFYFFFVVAIDIAFTCTRWTQRWQPNWGKNLCFVIQALLVVWQCCLDRHNDFSYLFRS